MASTKKILKGYTNKVEEGPETQTVQNNLLTEQSNPLTTYCTQTQKQHPVTNHYYPNLPNGTAKEKREKKN